MLGTYRVGKNLALGFLAVGIPAACSLTTDFAKFDSESNSDAGDAGQGGDVGPSGDGAMNADGATPLDPCSVSDPTRIFCSNFNSGAYDLGWDKFIASGAGDTGSLETTLFHSPPASARFHVPSASGRYGELLATMSLVDASELVAYVYIDSDSLTDFNSTVMLGLSTDDESDEISIRSRPTGARLEHVITSSNVETFPFAKSLPLKRFFSVRMRRDDIARNASLSIDDEMVLDNVTLSGTRPSSTRTEIRAGIVYAQDGTSPVTFVVDDVALYRR